MPTRGTPGSAGLDLASVECAVIQPLSWKAISTGLTVSIPSDCYARVAPRSGLAFNHGIGIGAGVIDSDYRGVIKVIMFNHSPTSAFAVQVGDRIAQLLLEKIYMLEPVEVDGKHMDATTRGSQGFGSTDAAAAL